MRQLQLLRQTYINPGSIKKYKIEQWNLLLKQSYATGLVARMYCLFQKNQVTEFIPRQLHWHFTSAMCFAKSYHQDILIEIGHIDQAFNMAGVKPVYLKGAAYLLAQDDASSGRLFADIDVYVGIKKLPDVERFLKWQGWSAGDIDEYDENYYRQWMHEIPALTHKVRGSILDLHHNLVPLTSRISIKAGLIETNTKPQARFLAIEDRIIHSMCHLFLESEFSHAMRDMTDLDMLIRQHSEQDPKFMTLLGERAIALGAEKIAFYATRYLGLYLQTPISDALIARLTQYAPPPLKLRLMDKLFGHVLFTPLLLDTCLTNEISHFLMFIRGHWLRMPFHLLIPHLFHKAFISPINQWRKAQAANKN